ncbi:MAG: 4a-hydroxytetrahydrobiopterin dehydratase [Janthinobacterium lividum]
MRLPLLTENEITDHLEKLPGWMLEDGTISKTYHFAGFMKAMEFVNQVAEAAEDVNHHPDIDIRFGKVTLALTTHDSSGLTLNDMDLAAASDDLADGVRQ